MKLAQLSTNGYAVTDVFDDATLAELIEITDSFTPDKIRPEVRHIKFLSDKKVINLLHNSFKDLVKNNPQKADLYKAKIQLAQTKLLVIAAKKKVELMRDKYKIK